MLRFRYLRVSLRLSILKHLLLRIHGANSSQLRQTVAFGSFSLGKVLIFRILHNEPSDWAREIETPILGPRLDYLLPLNQKALELLPMLALLRNRPREPLIRRTE
jgi:hypothetical protein